MSFLRILFTLFSHWRLDSLAVMGNLHRPELGFSFLPMKYLTRFAFIAAWLFLCAANLQAAETKPHIVLSAGKVTDVDGFPALPQSDGQLPHGNWSKP